MTCSSDRTIRFWHFIDSGAVKAKNRGQIQQHISRNAYCKDMSKIIFVKNSEDMYKYNFDVFKAKPLDRNEEGAEIQGVTESAEHDEIMVRKN